MTNMYDYYVTDATETVLCQDIAIKTLRSKARFLCHELAFLLPFVVFRHFSSPFRLEHLSFLLFLRLNHGKDQYSNSLREVLLLVIH